MTQSCVQDRTWKPCVLAVLRLKFTFLLFVKCCGFPLLEYVDKIYIAYILFLYTCFAKAKSVGETILNSHNIYPLGTQQYYTLSFILLQFEVKKGISP